MRNSGPRSSGPLGATIPQTWPNGRTTSSTCGRFCVGWTVLSTKSTPSSPTSRSWARSGFVWSITASAPSLRHHAALSSREAVATTRRPHTWRAIWMAIEPTPPAPPTTSKVRACSLLRSVGVIPMFSTSASQAVRAVSGIAAASRCDRVLGRCATIRSSTATYSAYEPGRATLPAK
nr:hypothetical protein [Nannocystis pusilla]